MNENKEKTLGKEHFEILLENIDAKFDLVMEGYQTLSNKVDTLDTTVNGFSKELHETREELIFLIKATVDHSEERLTKKIEDGDMAVMDHTAQKIDEVKDIIKTHTNRLDEHDERFLRPERKH